MNALKIAIIDDEPSIRKMLRIACEGEHWRVVEAGDAKSGLVLIAQQQPEVVFLDLGLPDSDGKEVLKNLRQWSDVPVIILTVRDTPEEKIEALDAGADDFITKPFHTGELLARTRAVIKRLQPSAQDAVIEAGALRVDMLEHSAYASSEKLMLTPIEFSILQKLVRHKGKIVTKHELIKSVWGEQTSSSDEHLRVHMAALRKKLRPHALDELIQTEPSVGYRFVPEDSSL